jgi:hypothetical protein
MRAILVILFAGTLVAACAAPRRIAQPDQVFGGKFLRILAPANGTWEIIFESSSRIAFGKGDRSAGESFVAWVAVFGLPPTSTSEEFESVIREVAKREAYPPVRFEMQQETISYTSERPYPCVRYKSVAMDRTPRAWVAPLLLELDALYCRHPVHPDSGFSVIYSYRGTQRHASLREEAENFIQKVQAPGQ